jgi:predicted enzyme related to lactoylglutathione lyase
MSMSLEMVTVDCTDPEALSNWWAAAVGGRTAPLMPGEFVMVVQDDGPRLGFQRVDDPTPGKNRVHLDFSTRDLDGEVNRLVGLGATETERHTIGGGFSWVVLTDPENNVFCVAAAGD